MFVTVLQKFRLWFLKGVLSAASHKAHDPSVVSRMNTALEQFKWISCDISGRMSDGAEHQKATQLARDTLPEVADQIAIYLGAIGEKLSKEKMTAENLACGVIVAAFTAQSLTPFPKVSTSCNKIMELVDNVEYLIVTEGRKFIRQ